MIRNVVVVLGAVVAGALGALAVQWMGGDEEEATTLAPPKLVDSGLVDSGRVEEGGPAERGSAPSTVPSLPAPLTSRFNPQTNPPPSSDASMELSGRSAVAPSSFDDASPRARTAVARNLSGAKAKPAGAFAEERRAALATFDRGDRNLGTQLLAGIYQLSKERAEIDLSEEAMRLFDAAESFAERREYASYLANRGRTTALFAQQLAAAQTHMARLEAEPSAAMAAWESLSLGYDLAMGGEQRRKVLVTLEPFLQRMVFASRYTPLLVSYTVVSGDTLSRIASRFGTTVGAVRRLNQLKSDVIQPRRRLRVLEGKVRVFVDKSDFRLWVTVGDKLLFDRPVGLGRDNATPVGTFQIGVRQTDPTWWRPGESPLPAGDPGNVLGSRWLGFRDSEELAGYGIHGTTDDSSIGKESSAGCVRLRNSDIELIYDFIPSGTPVVIQP